MSLVISIPFLNTFMLWIAGIKGIQSLFPTESGIADNLVESKHIPDSLIRGNPIDPKTLAIH
jgi:hypothetical protein